MNDQKLLPLLVNKQFEIAGIDFRMDDISEDGKIQAGNRKELWYDHYKFDTEEEYMEWREWIEQELKKAHYINVEQEANFVDLVYGMPVRITKEGELF